ncbi:MAG: dihydroneopterin aldolase [Solirubrobacterales bacterium]|nr:dihydroneopterin aldolase [Solirubrobacterales bacterium]
MSEPETGDLVITLSGIELHTNHGVTDAEQELGQRMLFDVELIPDRVPATETDEIEGTVDYGAVTSFLVEAATTDRYRTLERLVTVIADGLLDRFPVVEVRVRATKPEPPVPVSMDGASVEIFRSRES